MYLFTRAFHYIRKQKAKTVLLLVLFFVIANIVLAGLSVQSAATTAEKLTRQEIGSDITYTLNTQQVRSDTQKGVLDSTVVKSTLEGAPTYANLLKIADSTYIATVDAIATYEVTSDVLTPYTYVATTTTTTTNTNTPPIDAGGKGGFISGSYTSAGDFTLKTFTTITPTDFADKTASIARALATNVSLILADEPTGNLDTATEKEIISIFKKLASEYNCCVIVVAHSDDVAAISDISLRLKDGKFVENFGGSN